MCFPFDFRRLRRAYPLIPFNFPFKSLKSLYPLDFAENLLYPYNRTPPVHPRGGVRHGPTKSQEILTLCVPALVQHRQVKRRKIPVSGWIL